MVSESDSKCYYINLPWSHWGYVTGNTSAEVIKKAEAERNLEITRLEKEIEWVKSLDYSIEVEGTDDE